MSIIGPYGYSGGLNTDASLVTLPKGQVSSLQNMIVDQEQILPIPGYSTASIAQPPVTSPKNYYVAMVGSQFIGHSYLFLIFINNGGSPNFGVYYLQDFTGSWSSDIGNPASFGGLFDTSFCIEVLNGILTIAGQSAILGGGFPGGNAAQWTGSGNMSAFAGPSGCGIVKVVNNFMFALKSDGTLSWSAVADSLTWPAGNFLTFRFGDGDFSTALGKIGNTIYIFKLNSMGALQTNSVIISGAVALGPLYTVFDKIGTFSMRTIDNLPTGEIVFLGTDYNLYKFDGSNLANLSNRPYPQSSIQGAINSFLNSNNSGISSNNMWVRVNPLQKCIYLTIGGLNNFASATSVSSWAYDYLNDYWYVPPNFGDYVYLPSVGNIAGFIPSAVSQLFLVLANVPVSQALYSWSSLYSSFNGTAISGQAVVSIPYTFESRETIPRSIITAYSMNAADAITITPGADGNYGSGISPTPNGTLQRTIVPINFTDSTMTAQVEITTSTSNSYSINPLALDTEMAH